MASFFDAGSNQWVSAPTGNYVYKPAPHPPASYPVFDPSIDSWITTGDYGTQPRVSVPYFAFLQNAWVTS